jgi:hypothetical protein
VWPAHWYALDAARDYEALLVSDQLLLIGQTYSPRNTLPARSAKYPSNNITKPVWSGGLQDEANEQGRRK